MKFNGTNTIEKIISSRDDLTLNEEGGMAFSLSPEIELYQRIATCLVNEPKFYGSSDELTRIQQLIGYISQNNPEFILKLANYARNELRLRTIPVVMLVEASLNESTKKFVKQYTSQILTRPDQMTEALAYLKSRIGNLGNLSSTGSVPAGLKKGIAKTITNFDHYKLSKYNRDNEFKLKDVLKLCHPKPKDGEQAELFKSILNGTITPANTWEVIISGKGSNKETWTEASKVMPYMALVKNLRNFIEHGVDMKPILDKISDPEMVRKSKMLPFQLISAYNAIKGLPFGTA
ncbi:MAG: TROVE domain-containing protein, partial [Thaumarchaeota archaeon]|nr:TROVE domain-containing protein [Nitrososphaerota archaeon]